MYILYYPIISNVFKIIKETANENKNPKVLLFIVKLIFGKRDVISFKTIFPAAGCSIVYRNN